MTISIPLSFILFPITLPIALVRLVVASVVAVVLGLGTIATVTGEYESAFGYARKYTVLEEVNRKSPHCPGAWDCDVRKVRVRPGFIPFIAGAKPKIVKVWRRHDNQFMEDDGAPVPARLIQGIENAELAKAVKEKQTRLRASNLYIIHYSVAVGK